MIKYYIKLIDRIFNILWVYEHNNDSYISCLDNLIIELGGNSEYEEIIRVNYKLKGLLNNSNCNQIIVKKTVFGCIDLINIVISKIGGDIVE